MTDLVENPEDRFSHNGAHFVYKYLSHRPSRSERNILAWGNRSPEALSAVKTYVVIQFNCTYFVINCLP